MSVTRRFRVRTVIENSRNEWYSGWRAQYVKRTALSTIEIALKNNKVSRQGRACPDLVVQTRTHDLRQPLRSTGSSRTHPESDRRHHRTTALELSLPFRILLYSHRVLINFVLPPRLFDSRTPRLAGSILLLRFVVPKISRFYSSFFTRPSIV